jgi:murein DD-endopeptidase
MLNAERGAAGATSRDDGALARGGPVTTRMRVGRLSALVTLAALAAGCASSGAVPRPFPVPGPSPTGTRVPLEGAAIAGTALGLRGVPYRLGGADPSGFDCSGLVRYVLAQHGIASPRVVRDQFTLGRAVRLRDLQPGDLVFFRVGSRSVSHVGVALGGDRFVHAPRERGTVRVESLTADYWVRRFAGARRVEP